jgi:hypothetical protein
MVLFSPSDWAFPTLVIRFPITHSLHVAAVVFGITNGISAIHEIIEAVASLLRQLSPIDSPTHRRPTQDLWKFVQNKFKLDPVFQDRLFQARSGNLTVTFMIASIVVYVCRD